MHRRVFLLGPQRHRPIVAPAVAAITADVPGPIACITAGWEEREAEHQELFQHLQRPAVNLAIWQRVESIFERDAELLAAMRLRHDTLRKVQELYRLRLSGLMDACRALLRRQGDLHLLEPERQGAITMLQALDREHELRVADIHEEFEARWRPAQRQHVAAQRRELAALIGEASCVCIAGGHVGVLLHRLRLFDLPKLLQDKSVVAWSAGAMVLAERIVLFHDDPPQGAADAEVMEQGFGLVPGVVPLPHARRRLHLHDELRVMLMARRFLPGLCVALDDLCRLEWDGRRLQALPGTQQLAADGCLRQVPA